jgi:uncharacterized phiE125 gp8 family phage protein
MALNLIIAPAADLISLPQIKTHLKIEHSEEDELLQSLITAAVTHTERTRGLALLEQTWELALNWFPCGAIELPLLPALSITEIKYKDANGNEQTIATSDYRLLRDFVGIVKPAYGKSWPAARTDDESIKVKFKAGFGATAEAVPDNVKHAIKLLVGHWYLNREATNEREQRPLPLGYQALLAAYTRHHV